jgi:DNA invertase Pin-like site-specific DNA recombinase
LRGILHLSIIALNHQFSILYTSLKLGKEPEHLTFTGDDSPISKLMLSVMGAVHEFERALIKERQLEGIALAKKRGAFKGRKKSLSQAEIANIHQRIAAGMSKAQVAREFGISRQTLYQYL